MTQPATKQSSTPCQQQPCSFCEQHDEPTRKPWSAYLSPSDTTEKPTTIHVTKADGSHVAESDAAWIRERLNNTEYIRADTIPTPAGPPAEHQIVAADPRKRGQIPKYRKKPVIIEAVQLRWDTWSDVCDFAPVGENGCRGVMVNPNDHTDWTDGEIRFGGDGLIGLLIPTLEGEMLAVQDDFIIKGVQGEFYPCKPDIFEQTYEAVSDNVEP